MPDHLELLLKPSLTGQREVPAVGVLKQEYASRLLEHFGAGNTAALREQVTRELPIESALVEPVWVRGSMVIFPGCKDYRDKKELLESLYAIKGSEESGKSKVRIQEPATPNSSSSSKPHKKHAKTKSSTDEGEEGAKTQPGRRVSWSTVNTLDALAPADQLLSAADLQHPLFRALLQAPSFGEADIEASVNLFCANLADYSPRIRQDFSGKLFTSVKALLVSPLSVRFYGLLCHYVYWNILHPWARNMARTAGGGAGAMATDDDGNEQGRDTADADADGNESVSPSLSSHVHGGGSVNSFAASSLHGGGDDVSLSSDTSLAPADKESLFVQLEACLLQLHKKMGFSERQLVTAHQSQVCACHLVVDELLTLAYPWLNPAASEAARLARKALDDGSESNTASGARSPEPVAQVSERAKATGLRLRRLVHQSLADLLDPSRIFTNHMLIASYVGTHKQLTPQSSKAKYFATSMGVRAVFGDADSDKTRRFMMNAEEPYVAVPGVARRVGANLAAAAASEAAKGASQWQSQSQSGSGSGSGGSSLPALSPSAAGSPRDKPAQTTSRRVYPAQAPTTVPPSSLFQPSKSLDFSPVRNASTRADVAAVGAAPAAAVGTGGAAAVGAGAAAGAQFLPSDSAVARLARALSADIAARPHCGNEAQRLAFAEQAAREERQRTERLLREQRAAQPPVDFYRLWSTGPAAERKGRPGPGQQSWTRSVENANTFGAQPSRDDLQFLRRARGPSASEDDDLRSLVYNPNAEVRVSIRGKATLMSLVADRASAQYAHVASDTRPSLLLSPS